MTPSNDVFRGVFKLCQGIGNTTDYIDETVHGKKLPIIYVGESTVAESSNKDLIGTVNQTVHVYGTMTQRSNLDEIVGSVRNGMIKGIEEYGYRLTNPRVVVQTLQDKSIGQTLMHYVIEYRVVYTKIVIPKETVEPEPVVATIDLIEEGGFVVSGTGTPNERILIFISGGIVVTKAMRISGDGTYRYVQGYSMEGGDVVKVLRLADGSELATLIVPEEGSVGEEPEETPIEDFEYDEFYDLSTGRSYKRIRGYKGKSQTIKIPEMIDGLDVGAVQSSVFQGKALIKVELPKKLSNIGSSAFVGNSLKSVVLPNTIESLGSSSFKNNSLEDLELPNTLKTLGLNTFSSNSLEKVKLSENLVKIPTGAFEYNSIKEIAIPKGVTVIEGNAFAYNIIKRVVLSEGILTIESNAFRYNAIKELIIPNGVKTIGGYAFANNHLERVVIPPSVTSIGTGAFDNDVEVIHEDELQELGRVSMLTETSLSGNNEDEEIDNSGIEIYGYRGTEAERYANDNGNTFIALD